MRFCQSFYENCGIFMHPDSVFDFLLFRCMDSSDTSLLWNRIWKIWNTFSGNAGLGGGFKYFLFSPWSLGKWSNLTNIFFRWVETHHLVGTTTILNIAKHSESSCFLYTRFQGFSHWIRLNQTGSKQYYCWWFWNPIPNHRLDVWNPIKSWEKLPTSTG